MNGITKVAFFLTLVMIFALSVVGQAYADTYTYSFGDYNMFNPPHAGEVAPTGTWATATFTDFGDVVRLTLNVANELPLDLFMGEFYFNYSGTLADLTWNVVDVADSNPDILKGAFPANGDGIYDILFDFPPPPGQSDFKFTAGETVIVDFSSPEAGFSALSFVDDAAPGTGGLGPFQAAAKLGGIVCDDPTHPEYGECEGDPPTTGAWSGAIAPDVTPVPGDCNGDGLVDAGDLTALVMEIFDGDGNLPEDAPGGTFLGDPVGCDANEDGIIDAGDLTCTVLLIFNGPGACGGMIIF